jgi:hypothetical protein
VKFFIISLSVFLSSLAHAEIVQFTPDYVMAGNSSAFTDGVWVRVKGKVAHQNCYYAGQDVSLFYAKSNSSVDPNKVLSILLTAKMAGKQVAIVYAAEGLVADFWGFGISRCQIERLALI